MKQLRHVFIPFEIYFLRDQRINSNGFIFAPILISKMSKTCFSEKKIIILYKEFSNG